MTSVALVLCVALIGFYIGFVAAAGVDVACEEVRKVRRRGCDGIEEIEGYRRIREKAGETGKSRLFR